MKKYLSELLATFILVFCGTGAAIVNQQTNGVISHAGVAITFGMLVLSLIYAFGAVSGAHMNPAVSIAFWAAGRFPGKEIIPYAVSQFAGAIAASALLKILFPLNENLGATIPSGTWQQSFILEVVLTFILMLVVLQVATGSKELGLMAGIAIGAVVLFEAMFAGPISGASMNPARSLGPALVSWRMEHWWIYALAPTLGALLSVPVWKTLHTKPTGS